PAARTWALAFPTWDASAGHCDDQGEITVAHRAVPGVANAALKGFQSSSEAHLTSYNSAISWAVRVRGCGPAPAFRRTPGRCGSSSMYLMTDCSARPQPGQALSGGTGGTGSSSQTTTWTDGGLPLHTGQLRGSPEARSNDLTRRVRCIVHSDLQA